MRFLFQWFQFLLNHFFAHFSNRLITIIKKSSFSKYSFRVCKGGYQPLGGGCGEIWYNQLQSKVLLNYLILMMKWFWGNENICSIVSLDLSTLDIREKATVYGVVCAITTNYDGVIGLCETGV